MRREVPEIQRHCQRCGDTEWLAIAVRGMTMQIAMIGLAMMMAGVLVVGVMLGWIRDRLDVCWNVRGEGFAADMLQIVGRFVPVSAVGRMLFVMPVMAVRSIHQ